MLIIIVLVLMLLACNCITLDVMNKFGEKNQIVKNNLFPYQPRAWDSPNFVVGTHQRIAVPAMAEGRGLEVFSVGIGRRPYQAQDDWQQDQTSE